MLPGVDKVFHIVCGAHLFVLSNDKQSGLESEAVAAAAVVVVAAVARNGSKFSQYNVVWGGFMG
jgi:hypothetical protein